MEVNVENKKPLVIVTGPTAAGKSALAVALAGKIGGEIISADSMQVYRHMDIGSAKITREEMEGIEHYLIDVLEPSEDFHVVKFKELATEAMKRIYAKGKIPIITGGTGFYIQSVLYDIDFTQTGEDMDMRLELEQFARENGNEALFERLRAIDPDSCKILHANNIKRVIRAIEFFEKTGKPISQHNEEQREKESPYRFAYFVLTDKRERLYAKIDARVDEMLKKGLVEEVKALKNMGCTKDQVSMQGLGYKEILEYLDKECSLEDAIYRIKRDTRHFAKRQLTWFRREKEVIWISREDFANDAIEEQNIAEGQDTQDALILEHMLEILTDKEVISGGRNR
ncbi:MAG: tRNA (adenosine(37)-N6)-dimethylallyltransferase MiaA [Roseburia sp.]|nr:tRNA (adenosine(37)-N6)-dimethylallyltransferase MiaA [Ruminococcus sp.]MCM1154576.1 tRNA (adenosine(37)-N6)-dimethylallyltransferase MiaA [Roseburia sp.]MCM1243103.1 tRNA (adenosine(37)-N6)-dimethylallyltransferase MiaA [Roseburia sp.]